MQSENKTCQNCKATFTIEPDDFSFYEKIQVPPPTFCPECRMQRRMAFFNLQSLYTRNCDKCQKKTVSIYPPNKKLTVYCNDCWWGEDWDWKDTAMDYDPTRPFFEQLIELRDKTVFMALEGLYSSYVNTTYTSHSSYQKDCFMTLFSDYADSDIYTNFTANTKEVMDSYRISNSELIYDSLIAYKGYKCFFCENVGDSFDMWFSKDCFDCTNCFGCVNLRKKNYYIYNQPYTKEEYFEKLKQYNLTSRTSLHKVQTEVEAFWLKHPRRFYSGDSRNVDVSGESVYESKNTHEAFIVVGAENSKFIQMLTLASTKDCYDYTGWGAGAELIYEAFLVGSGASGVRFSAECWPEAYNVEYSYYCTNAPKNLFGCINTRNAEYCILNKQYTKEEYEALKLQIISDMNKNPFVSKNGTVYTYGEFFPPEFTVSGYNETMAHEYMPLTKDQALAHGFGWYEGEVEVRTPTILSQDIPDNTSEVQQSISKEILQCASCKGVFNITTLEVDRLLKLELPYPDKCWRCRHKRRFDRSPKPFLYNRTCAKCNKDIRTWYAPERPEVVYCESCYQKEVM